MSSDSSELERYARAPKTHALVTCISLESIGTVPRGTTIFLIILVIYFVDL
nr:MAG TPA: hypothetical protein [Caudoviricetes sp.]